MKILTVLILVGSIQGFISSALLYFFRKGNNLSNRILSIIILCISLACLNMVLLHSGMRYTSSTMKMLAYIMPLLIVMPIGPLIYFYVRTGLDPTFKLEKTHRVHFYPLILDLFPYAAGAILVAGLLTGLISSHQESVWKNLIDEFFIYSDIPRWLSITSYTAIALRKVYVGKTGLQNENWIRSFLFVFATFQFLWLIHLIPYIIPSSRESLLALVDWYPVYLPLVFLVYWLGINGFIQILTRHSAPVPKKSTLSLALTPEAVANTIQQLKSLMERDKLYLDPFLNLEKVVSISGIPQKTISAVLNQHLEKSFNEFVNGYRVLELQKKLVLDQNKNLTIMGIALDCGFNSQATMQRTFRQFTNQSPREFQLNQQAENAKKKLVDISQI